MVGAAVTVAVKYGNCESAGVAVGGLTPIALRASPAQAALVGVVLDWGAIATAADAAQNDLGDDIPADMHVSTDYRRAMATEYVSGTLRSAAERARQA